MVATYPLTIEAGASKIIRVTWLIDDAPVNLAGYTAEYRIGSDPRGTGDDNYLTLTQANGITLGGSSGQITVVIPKEQTSAFAFCDAAHQLDLIDASGVSTRLLHGGVTLNASVPGPSV